MSEEFDPDNRGQVILYRANGVNVPVEVTYWRRTFWMPQKNIARLFGVNVPAVSKHLANIYAEGELAESATMSEMEIVRNEGGRTVRRTIRFYSLDAIIAVGYRVSSPQATAFRQWATSVLHEYMIKGFALNDDMLKNGNTFGEDYFKELLARVREIRTSEKRLYQQVLAIFQEICTDYDKDSGVFSSCSVLNDPLPPRRSLTVFSLTPSSLASAACVLRCRASSPLRFLAMVSVSLICLAAPFFVHCDALR